MEEQLASLSSVESDVLLDFVARLSPQWLAGFFDGEGCVCGTIQGGSPNLQITLTQKDPAILAIISLKFPAKIQSNGGDGFRLAWGGKSALPFLEFIKDYVIIKKRQVELAFEFIPLIADPGQKVSPEAKARRFTLVSLLKDLK